MKRTLALAASSTILAAGFVVAPATSSQAATRQRVTCSTQGPTTTCVSRPVVKTVRTRDTRGRVVLTRTSTVRKTVSTPVERTTTTTVTTTRVVGRTTRVSTRTTSTYTPLLLTPPPPPTRAQSVASAEQWIFDLTNVERAKAGLKPFASHAQVTGAARDWSATMARTGSFTHRPDWAWTSTLGGFTAAAENIFRVSGDLDTLAEKAVNGWMNSPGHRANILNPALTHLGVGVAVGRDGSLYATQNFAGLR